MSHRESGGRKGEMASVIKWKKLPVRNSYVKGMDIWLKRLDKPLDPNLQQLPKAIGETVVMPRPGPAGGDVGGHTA